VDWPLLRLTIPEGIPHLEAAALDPDELHAGEGFLIGLDPLGGSLPGGERTGDSTFRGGAGDELDHGGDGLLCDLRGLQNRPQFARGSEVKLRDGG
jgi:hypothetical protein